MELRETFRPSYHSDVCAAVANEVGAIDDSIGSRRTGCRDTGHLREDVELVGNHIRRSPTIVGFDILVVIVVCQEVKIVALALVHTPHSSPRYEGYIIPPPFGGG